MSEKFVLLLYVLVIYDWFDLWLFVVVGRYFGYLCYFGNVDLFLLLLVYLKFVDCGCVIVVGDYVFVFVNVLGLGCYVGWWVGRV